MKLEIGNQIVEVGDEFASLSKAEQDQVVAQIAREIEADAGLTGALRTADDVMRLAGNAMTFNLADKIAAMGDVGPIDYFGPQGTAALAAQRAKTDAARSRLREQGGGTWATVPESIPLIGGAEIGLDTAVDTASGVALGGGLARNGVSLLTSAGGRAAGTLGRLGRAAAEGAGYGAAYNVGSTDSGNVPDYVWNAVKGAKDGALFGGVMQGAGQTAVGVGRSIAKNTRRVTGRMTALDRTSARTQRLVGEAIGEDGITPQNAQQYGPETIFADNGVASRNLLRGATQRPSPEANAVRRQLAERADRRSQRLQNDVNDQFGPMTQYPDERMGELLDAMGRVSPRLQQVFASGQVDARGVLTSVRLMLRTARGPQQAALQRVERMLVERAAQPEIAPVPATPDRWEPDPSNPMMQRFVPGTPGRPGRPAQPEVVVSDPETLHNVKVTMDGMIDYGDPANGIPAGSVRQKDGALRNARRNLFGQLDSQLEGYNAAMDEYRLIRRRMEGLQTGRDALDRGKGAMRPDQLRRIQTADGSNAAPEIRQGMRARVDELVGTMDELPALRSTLGGEYNWNRQKLADNFGQDRVDNLVRSVDREQVFNATRDAGFGGSRSIENAAADQALQRAAPNRMIRLVDVPFRILDYVGEKIAGRNFKNVNREVARITGLRGQALTDFVRQMDERLATNRRVGRNTAASVPGLLNATGKDEAIPFITDAQGRGYGYFDPNGTKKK